MELGHCEGEDNVAQNTSRGERIGPESEARLIVYYLPPLTLQEEGLHLLHPIGSLVEDP